MEESSLSSTLVIFFFLHFTSIKTKTIIMGELPAYDLAVDEFRILLSYANEAVTTDLPKYKAPAASAPKGKAAAKKVCFLELLFLV
jgi:hypothetical protein